MRKKFTQLLILATVILLGVVQMNAQEETIFNVDFTQWESQTIGNTSAESENEVNGITFHTYNKRVFTIANGIGMTWCNNNFGSKYWLAIPLTGVNGSITVSVNNDATTSVKYEVHAGSTIPTSIGSGTGTASTAGNPTSFTISGLTGIDYILVLGRNGGSYSNVKSITVTTPKSSTASVTTTPDAETGLSFGSIAEDATRNLTLNVKGVDLSGDLTISSDNTAFSLGAVTTIAKADAEKTTGKDITVTFAPNDGAKTYEGTITISGGGLTSPVAVPVAGTATAATTPFISSLAMETDGITKETTIIGTDITAVFPYGTDLTAVTVANIEYGGNADHYSPTEAQNFETATDNTIVYTAYNTDESQSKAYNVTITTEAPSTDATLSNISLNGVTIDGFDPETEDYTYTYDFGTTPPVQGNFTATTNHSGATHDITTVDNKIVITVTAQDNSTEKTYTIELVEGAEVTDVYIYFGAKNTLYNSTDPTKASGDLTEVPATSNASCMPSGITTAYRTSTITIFTFTLNSTTAQDIIIHAYAGGNGERKFKSVEVDGEDITSTVIVEGAINDRNKCTPLTLKGINAKKGSVITFNFESSIALNYLQVTPIPPTPSIATLTATVGEDAVNGVVKDDEGTIKVEFPTGTDLTAVAIDVTYDGNGHHHTPAGAQNFATATNNTIEYTVYNSSETQSKTYNVTVTAVESNDATLSDLKVNGETIKDFAPDKTEYEIEYPYGETAPADVIITATPNHANANAGEPTRTGNTITIKVIAENGAEKVYTISYIEAAPSSDAKLSDLLLDNITIDGFNAATFTYNVSLPAGTTVIPTVTATAANTCTIKEGDITQATLPLPGSATIVVTAQDNSTTQTYTINFKEATPTRLRVTEEISFDLTKDVIDEQNFIGWAYDDKWQNGTYCNLPSNTYPNVSTSRNLTFKVDNAASFDITVQCGSTGRGIKVTIGNNEPVTKSHEGTGCEIISIPMGENTGETDIIITSSNNSVYPIKITFYPVTSQAPVATEASGAWSDPATWETAGVPTATSDIIIKSGHQISADADVTIKSVEVEATGDLVINENLTLTGDLILSKTQAGGSLLHKGANGNLSVTGKTYVKVSFEHTDRWNFVGFPFEVSGVTDADGNSVTHQTDYWLRKYNVEKRANGIAAWEDATETLPQKGVAYIIWAPARIGTLIFEVASGTDMVDVFALDPTTPVSLSFQEAQSGSNAGWNFIVHPSFSDWNLDLEDTQFRYKYNYTADDYSTESGTGIGCTNDIFSAYFVKTPDVSTCDIKYCIPGNRSAVARLNSMSSERISLKLNNNGYDYKTVVRIHPEATEGYDNLYDAPHMMAMLSSTPQIYSLINSGKMAINSLPKDGACPIGIRVAEAGEYTIRWDNGVVSQKAYLFDSETNRSINMNSEEEYTFITESAGEINNRFQISFAPNSTTVHRTGENTDVKIYTQKGNLVIEGLAENTFVRIYDIAGNLIHNRIAGSATVTTRLPQGMYVVELGENSKTRVKIVNN
ncbi:hypothetical protein D0T49_08880 [Paludibacter sp. 221]|uniref:cadherin-like beta sandwich domain-containing protein n=1 Tax=Paludibacter sp. 221 TaxID=2302939 RepID=UPI0013D0630C|nr:cadherin-like beta sandwich domain-containing protein [Paludibacter sp. 221]NDV47157.1 hypothetical protein [Paludibacter sp. 221]